MNASKSSMSGWNPPRNEKKGSRKVPFLFAHNLNGMIQFKAIGIPGVWYKFCNESNHASDRKDPAILFGKLSDQKGSMRPYGMSKRNLSGSIGNNSERTSEVLGERLGLIRQPGYDCTGADDWRYEAKASWLEGHFVDPETLEKLDLDGRTDDNDGTDLIGNDDDGIWWGTEHALWVLSDNYQHVIVMGYLGPDNYIGHFMGTVEEAIFYCRTHGVKDLSTMVDD